jgi:hypothetical protein
MAFSQSLLTLVYPPQVCGSQVYLSWQTSAAGSNWWQVYVNQQLAWSGQRLWTWVPIPSGPVRIDIGAVDAGEEYVSFAAALPPAPMRRARLTWQSGTYTAPDLAGFRVYGANESGGAIDYTTVLAEITAYPAGIVTDGFGFGGFGASGFGQAASSYSFTSEPLEAGAWSFAVVPFDTAGNPGSPMTTTITITAPPRTPATFADTTTRLQYNLKAYGETGFGSGGFGLPAAILNWNPSPS